MRLIRAIIVGIITYLLLSSCAYKPPTNYGGNQNERVSPYEKYKARELQREQLRYYRNQNNK